MRSDQETLGGVTRWLTPVKTTDDLPQDEVEDGSYCFVEALAEVMVFRNGSWGLAQSKGLPDAE